jgi:hypothetical protein
MKQRFVFALRQGLSLAADKVTLLIWRGKGGKTVKETEQGEIINSLICYR